MKTLKAIEHLEAEDFPNWWVYNIVQDGVDYSAGGYPQDAARGPARRAYRRDVF